MPVTVRPTNRTVTKASGVLLLLLCACQPTAPAATTEAESGIVVDLRIASTAISGQPGDSCDLQNLPTFDMAVPGSQMTVSNEDGTTVGVGTVPTTGEIVEGRGAPPFDIDCSRPDPNPTFREVPATGFMHQGSICTSGTGARPERATCSTSRSTSTPRAWPTSPRPTT
jgi:hypothetical protein